MKPALLLIDLQFDFLARQGLIPAPDKLVSQVSRLLKGCRDLQIPVIHIHTQIRQDGSDRMPHWKQNNIWNCVEGTAGVLAPEPLRPGNDELLFTKQFFSAFGSASLDAALREHGADTVIVAGLYLHGCIRSTVLDAYERGYEVWVVEDAVGSTEPAHAEMTHVYLDDRAARFITIDQVLCRSGSDSSQERSSSCAEIPVACIMGEELKRASHACIEHRNPSNRREVIASVPVAGDDEVESACTKAAGVQTTWKKVSPDDRSKLLFAWAEALAEKKQELAQLLALEIGKPMADARDEIDRAVSLVRMTASQLHSGGLQIVDNAVPVFVRDCPHGVIGIVTPWNNPVAIPAGKIAPALAYGNTVVWKPAIEAARTSLAIFETIPRAEDIVGIVNPVFGDASTARRIIEHPLVNAVTLTGSVGTGMSTAAQCARIGKPLQAELGGNNPAIVLRDCNLHAMARQMALSAFSFSGQRCTAIQRFIVERSILDEFEKEFISAVKSLRVGVPFDKDTNVGPLISHAHRQSICSMVERAVKDGARILCGGTIPAELESGCWLLPTVIAGVASDSRIAQEEIFGPVVIVLPAEDLDDAIAIANRVRHGLVATLYSSDESNRRRFADGIEAGMLNFAAGPLDVHPEAAFSGWKASGIGPPEHGKWDRQFYSKVQSVYAWDGLNT